ncbi:hypothetical protein LCGC14_1367980 [marine sediment metagenome]|uniref:Uncharacterized protein n=1 Tax=marine sediment metagenome TaxID=412755 RepID=A0A0F9KS57_9ZZZZ
MTSRAERRRQQRGEKKTSTGATRQQLREAEEELDSGTMTMEASHATTFSIMVSAWHMLEHQREGARVTYGRVKELKASGRDVQTDAIVKQYAEAKQELEILEDQMHKFLLEVAEDGEGEAEELVAMRHPVPGTGMTYKLPDQAADRIWGADDPDDDDPPAEPGDNKA